MEKIFQRLNKERLTPNQWYVLFCAREKIAPSGVNIYLELRGLVPEWIEDSVPTARALSLLMDIDDEFKGKIPKKDEELMGKNYMDSIKKYRDMFPVGKLPSGKYARDSMKNLEGHFRWFFKNFEYDWDTVFKATEKYVSEYRDDSYKFMRTSKYFICKG